VRQWLVADDANSAHYSQLKKIWDESRQLASATTSVDENKAWQKFQQRIHPVPVRRMKFGWMGIAASVVVTVCVGLLLYWTLNNDRGKKVTVFAQQSVLNDTLPDGSLVIINKGSSISYPSKFKKEARQVDLNGEAFFSVKPNKEKPFIIYINDVQVRVVGTSFNVKNINDNIEVVVESGVVIVTKAGKTVELMANEKLVVEANDSVMVKEKVTDQLYKYYRTKQFVCDDTPLWKLVQVVNEAYHTHVVIGNPALKDMTITTTFYNESFEQVLNVISITFNIRVIKQGDTFTLQ
jgi:ferric-dicitrate binding protein FerR (iron transport regulator)